MFNEAGERRWGSTPMPAHAFRHTQGPRSVGPDDGKYLDLGSLGVRFMTWAEETRRRILAGRAPDPAEDTVRAAPPSLARGRIQLRARGRMGAAGRRRRLRRCRRLRVQAARPVAHVLERRRHALPDPRDHRPGGFEHEIDELGELRREPDFSRSSWDRSARSTGSNPAGERARLCASTDRRPCRGRHRRARRRAPLTQSTNRRSTAQRLSSWRFESWSFRRTAETCASTVFTEIESSSAISL